MKNKPLPSGYFRCGICDKILPTKKCKEHMKSKEHLKKANDPEFMEKVYEDYLEDQMKRIKGED